MNNDARIADVDELVESHSARVSELRKKTSSLVELPEWNLDEWQTLVEGFLTCGDSQSAFALGVPIDQLHIAKRDALGRAVYTWILVLYEVEHWDELTSFAEQWSEVAPPYAGRIQMRLAWRFLRTGNSAKAEERVEHARSLARPLDTALLGDIAAFESFTSPTTEQAREKANEAELYFRRAPSEVVNHVRILHRLAVILQNEGQLLRATSELQRAMRLAEEAANPFLEASLLRQFAILSYRQGHYDTSQRAVAYARTLVEKDLARELPIALLLIETRVDLYRHDTDAANRKLNQIYDELPATGDERNRALYCEYRAILLIQDGESDQALDQALDHLKTALDIYESLGAESTTMERAEAHLHAAEAHLLRGHFEDALAESDRAAAIAKASGNVLELGEILTARARAAFGRGNDREGQRQLDVAIEQLRRVGNPHSIARALMVLAEQETADPEESVSAAAEAIAILERLRVEPLENQARDLLSDTRAQAQRMISSQRLKSQRRLIPFLDYGIVAESETMKSILELATAASETGEAPVLISGESGVGKSLIARYIHQHSRRSKAPFVVVDCAALPETFLEVQLFPPQPDALPGRASLVSAASGGTLFLDNIDSLPSHFQERLALLLDQKRYGDDRDSALLKDVRVVATSQSPAEDALDPGLLERLKVFSIEIPPLREREKDILPLANYFVEQLGKRFGFGMKLSESCRSVLQHHHWLGNASELRGTISRAMRVGFPNKTVLPDHLKPLTAPPIERFASGDLRLEDFVEEQEKDLLQQALVRTKSRAEAARFLGISRQGLYNKVRKYKISS